MKRLDFKKGPVWEIPHNELELILEALLFAGNVNVVFEPTNYDISDERMIQLAEALLEQDHGEISIPGTITVIDGVWEESVSNDRLAKIYKKYGRVIKNLN